MSDAEVLITESESILVVEGENNEVSVESPEDSVLVVESQIGPSSTDVIKNISRSGGYRITNMRLGTNKEIIIEYEEEPTP